MDGRRGAELVRADKLGRILVRGVEELDEVGERLDVSPCSVSLLDDFARFDLLRLGYIPIIGLSMIYSQHALRRGPAPCQVVGSSQL